MNVGLLTKKKDQKTPKTPVKNTLATLKHFLVTPKMVQLVLALLPPKPFK